MNQYLSFGPFNLTFLSTVFVVSVCITLVSCSSDEVDNSDTPLVLTNGEIKRELLANSEITDEHLKLLKKAGFGGSHVNMYSKENLTTGKKEIEFLVDGDAYVRMSSLEAISAELDSNLSRQYRTTGIVRPTSPYDQVYTLFLRGSNWNNYPNVVQGIRDAAENYNNIGFRTNRFTVQQVNDPNYQASSLYRAVYVDINNLGPGVIARAGFPIAYTPPFSALKFWKLYDQIQFSPRFLPGMSRVKAEETMTHELGHCMGIRHTDYFNRSISCVDGGNEGQGDIGAIHVPGTPSTTNVDMSSIFLSCGPAVTTGNFSNYDRQMLQNTFSYP